MVYPVGDITFKVNDQGRVKPGNFVTIADVETFELGFDNGVEEWYPMGSEGWVARLLTAKSITLSLSGKRNYGDAGNDYVASKSMVSGQSANSIVQMVFPNSDTLELPCVINVTACGGGDSTGVGALEAEYMSDGKPTYAEGTGVLADLTFVCSDGTGAGSTKIVAVSPVLDGSNSYYYKINGVLPEYGEDITGKGWIAYILAADIATAVGNNIALVEVVTASKLARKGGIAPAVIV